MLSATALKWSQKESTTILVPPKGQSNLIQRAHALADLIDLCNKSYVPLLQKCVPYSNEEGYPDPDNKKVIKLPDCCAICNELDDERAYLLFHLTYRVGAMLKTLDDPVIDDLVDTADFWFATTTKSQKLINGLAVNNPTFKALYDAGNRLVNTPVSIYHDADCFTLRFFGF